MSGTTSVDDVLTKRSRMFLENTSFLNVNPLKNNHCLIIRIPTLFNNSFENFKQSSFLICEELQTLISLYWVRTRNKE